MEKTVYIDLYFMINFAMDFLCLYLADGLLSQKSSLIRRAVAAAVGAIYACVSLIIAIHGISGFALDAAACLAIVAIAHYKRGKLRYTLGTAVVFCACSILLGGFMTALFSVFNRIGLDRLLSAEGDSDGISVWLFALLAVLGGASALLGGRFFKKKAARRYCELGVLYRDRSLKLRAICDSGNLLRDPISALPCIIVELEAARELIGEQTYDAIRCNNVSALPPDQARRIRIVPTKSVSGSQLLFALRADSVWLDFGKGRRDVLALIAFATVPIAADGCRAIVPSELCASL